MFSLVRIGVVTGEEPRPQLIVGLDGLMYFNPGLPYRIDVYNGAGKLLKRIH